jgi:rhodanese-related sulfurtransferase
MKRLLSQILLLGLAAVIMGLGRNVVAPGGIPWVGDWARIDSLAALAISNPGVKPPSAEEGDPPFLSLAEAMAKHADPNVVFIDAREPEEYHEGHIAGAILLPFDYFDDYWPTVQETLPLGQEIVTYCSGAECESSLFLARYMRGLGYEKISIFYGGWLQWQKGGGPVTAAEATSDR